MINIYQQFNDIPKVGFCIEKYGGHSVFGLENTTSRRISTISLLLVLQVGSIYLKPVSLGYFVSTATSPPRFIKMNFFIWTFFILFWNHWGLAIYRFPFVCCSSNIFPCPSLVLEIFILLPFLNLISSILSSITCSF